MFQKTIILQFKTRTQTLTFTLGSTHTTLSMCVSCRIIVQQNIPAGTRVLSGSMLPPQPPTKKKKNQRIAQKEPGGDALKKKKKGIQIK